MARHRRSNAGTKRTERPIAGVVLGPLAELPLAPNLADEIEMRWHALGPIGHDRFVARGRVPVDAGDVRTEHARWLANTQLVVERVLSHSQRWDFGERLVAEMAEPIAARKAKHADEPNRNFADQFAADVVTLVRRDQRYLASDLVVGVVLLRKLMVLHGMQLGRGTAKAKRSVAAERARKYLADLAVAARALGVVTGRGRKEFISPITLLADHEHHIAVVRDVAERIAAGKTDDEIAKEFENEDQAKVADAAIAAIRARPSAAMEHAEQLTMALYRPSFQVDQLRRLLSDSRDALDPRPPGWPRLRRARRSKSRVRNAP